MPDHPKPTEPTLEYGPHPAPRVVLHCRRCGGKTGDAASYCAQCGHALLGPAETTCLGCGGPLPAGVAPHCADCGAYVPQRLRGARPLSSRSRASRLAAAVVAASGLWLVAQAAGQWLGAVGQAPSLAGVQVGDAQGAVERKLGRPERRDSEIFWTGPDGAAHRVIAWQYGVTSEGGTPIADLTVTFLDGQVYQVGVLEKGFKTSEGLAVGDPVGKASRLYGTAIEEDMVSGLQPMKFLKGGVVVKIVTLPGDDHLLAIGIESPKNLPLDSASQNEHGETPGSASLGEDIPSTPI